MKKIIAWLLSLSLLSLLAVSCGRTPERTGDASQEQPLACISLTLSDDSFMQSSATVFTEVMSEIGYRSQVVYCEGSVITQLKQIQNAITSGAKLIYVNCAGNGEEYLDVLREAQRNGVRVIAIVSGIDLAYSDVQIKQYTIFKGVVECKLVKSFLDKEYADADPGSVSVLMLEASSSIPYIRMSAGMKIIKEKYLRYFDYATLDYIRTDGPESVLYKDARGSLQWIDEPSGGLILDENGLAQLNPYYDARVRLIIAKNRNVLTNIDAQKAIDAAIASPGGSDIRIVMSFSGDAAKGANEKLLFYAKQGTLTDRLDKLAVFGSDDTIANRELLLQSATNTSVLRGFVCTRDMKTRIRDMVQMALEQSTQRFYTVDYYMGRLNSSKNEVVIDYASGTSWENPDMFFDQMKG